MSDAFDPYRKWLGIPPDEQPPHHYRLLGIGLFENDPEVIESAADQRVAHLRTFQTGRHSALSQKLLNEVVSAKLCLLLPQRRAAYDAELRQRLDAKQQPSEQLVPTAMPPSSAARGAIDVPIAMPTAAPTHAMAAPRAVNATVLRSGRAKSHRPTAVWWAAGAAAVAVLALITLLLLRESKPSPSTESPVAEESPTSSQRRSPAKIAPANAGAATSSEGNRPPAPLLVANSTKEAPPLAVAPFDAQQARAHQAVWAAYLKTPVEQKNSISMRLVLIPPGEFTMGSTPEQIAAAKKIAELEKKSLDWTLERLEAEAPAHRVKISRPFLLGATEVTIGQYRRFVEATSYVTETERFGGGSSVSKEENDPQKKSQTWYAPVPQVSDESAVGQITWNDAVAFCNWLSDAEKLSRCYRGSEQEGWTLEPAGEGYRLPTEAEWEYACRAGTTTQYSFADDVSKVEAYCWSDRAGALPFPVVAGSKLPNPFGLYDMHGNADEWCWDWFSPTYYAQSPAEDPDGPPSGDARTLRGGGWTRPLAYLRSAFRGSYGQFWRFGELGFRVVRVSTVRAEGSVSPAAAGAPPVSKTDAADEAGPSRAIAPFDAKQARAHQEAWAAFLKTPVEQKNSFDMPLVLLPPGEFMMGSTPEQIADAKRLAQQAEGDSDQWSPGRIEAEAPAHRVTISRPFLIGATEVTVAQYRRFVDVSGYLTETERLGGGDSTKKDEQDPEKKSRTWRGPANGDDDAAVRQVTWNDAAAFCNWLSDAEKLSRCYRGGEQDGWVLESSGEGYRLPTEAEWEYACRAGTTTHYSFGDDPSAFAQYGWSLKAEPIPQLRPVAEKLPNPFGLYEMHGNVSEWCQDWFPSDYQAQTPLIDPTGPALGETKIYRGGALDSPIVRCRSAFRGNFLPIARFYDHGFRVVRVAVANSESGRRKAE